MNTATQVVTYGPTTFEQSLAEAREARRRKPSVREVAFYSFGASKRPSPKPYRTLRFEGDRWRSV